MEESFRIKLKESSLIITSILEEIKTKTFSSIQIVCKVIQQKQNILCIPENFNPNISQQLFDYTITFVNSQH